MSVVINTNFAASVASNNLASANQALQRSLTRLSSGSKIVSPADDAGGLAVSMKLSSTARRQGAAATNIANGISFLQTQDGSLQVTGKILSRIGELKTLNSDPTKNSDDRANYQAEFAQLQAQLTALGGEKFNGKALFGSTGMSINTTADGSGAVSIGGVDLLDAPPFAPFTDNFANFSNWTAISGTPGVSGNSLYPKDSVRTNATFTGSMEIEFDVYVAGSSDSLTFKLGSDTISRLADGSNITRWAWHSVRISFDGAGNARTYLNGSSTASDTRTGIGATSGQLSISNIGAGSSQIRNFSVTSGEPSGNTYSVSTVSNLDTLGQLTVTNALQDVATFRATNGAQQSRLQFASEVLTVNKSNIEAANSRITDVDVAQESTQMARYNILVQAGTAMLSQANQSAQAALRLIG